MKRDWKEKLDNGNTLWKLQSSKTDRHSNNRRVVFAIQNENTVVFQDFINGEKRKINKYFLSKKSGKLRLYYRGENGLIDKTPSLKATLISELKFKYKKPEERLFNLIKEFYSEDSKTILGAAYPLLDTFERDDMLISSIISPFFLKDNYRNAVEKIYGKNCKSARQSFVKNLEYTDTQSWGFTLVKNDNIGNLISILLFKNLIPIDMLTKFKKSISINKKDFKTYRNFLKSFDHNQLKRLSKDFIDISNRGVCISSWTLRDILTLKDDGIEIPNKFSSFEDIHDQMARAHRERIGELTNKEELLVKYKEFGNSEYLIRQPKTKGELKEWAKDLRNCLSGYGYSINNGNSEIFGVFNKSGKLIAATEIQKGVYDEKNITQLFGTCNQNLEEKKEKDIRELFYKEKIVKKPKDFTKREFDDFGERFFER